VERTGRPQLVSAPMTQLCVGGWGVGEGCVAMDVHQTYGNFRSWLVARRRKACAVGGPHKAAHDKLGIHTDRDHCKGASSLTFQVGWL
jgi:hypothetical protein